jgi:hypothetical protein
MYTRYKATVKFKISFYYLINRPLPTMQKIVLIPALFFLSTYLHAQVLEADIGLSYSRFQTIDQMGTYIPHGNGIGVDLMIRPINSRFAVGLDVGHSIYGRDQDRQEYTFEEGIKADMDIVVNNTITNFMVVGRYFLRNNATLIPFVQAKLGHASFGTRLFIYDPDDFDHCAPIDTELLLRDGTLVKGLGAGLQWQFSEVMVLNLSADLLMGGGVKYMSVDGPEPGGRLHSAENEVSARFIHVPSQIIHEHHVGHVYQSALRTFDLRFGLAYRITK